MPVSREEFLTRLRRSITSFYTASYSSDTDVYKVLDMYATQLFSGSIAVDEIYNDLSIILARSSQLYYNFGTYLKQSKYFQQERAEDRYVEGSGSIPCYVKTIDFLTDAALHGSTLHAINRVGNAFTLINPDIRELYNINRWKLYATSGSIDNTDGNVLTISLSGSIDPGWKRDSRIGALATLSSGSGTSKIVATYLVTSNTQNTVTMGPIF